MDTRDLQEKRDELMDEVLTAFNETFGLEVGTYEEVEQDDIPEAEWAEFLSKWEDEIAHIDEINALEEEIGSEFKYGEYMVPSDKREDYVQEMVEDCGYISKDFPSWIYIDWERTAKDVAYDYLVVTYQGEDYYVRNC